MSSGLSFEVCRKSVAHGLWAAIVLCAGAALAAEPVSPTETPVRAVRPASRADARQTDEHVAHYELFFIQPVTALMAPQPKTEQGLFLTRQDAAYLALLNNREIKIERLTSRVREEEIRREHAAFHPQLTVESSTEQSEKPSASVLAGSDSPETDSINWNSGVRTRLITGAVASLDFINQRFESNSVFQTLSPSYSSDLVFSLTQPLLKNFGPAINRTRIKVAENNREISQHQLQVTIANILVEVENAYWDVTLASRDLEIKRRSLKLVQHLARRTRELVREGRLPEIAIFQAKMAVFEKERDVLMGKNALTESLSRLKHVLNLDPSIDRTVVPLDQPTTEIKQVDIEQAQKVALTKRPELPQVKLDLRNKRLILRHATNQRLPQLNLFGSIGLSGLAGSSTLDPRVQAALGLQTDFSVSEGGYGTSLEDLFSGDSPTWRVGIKLTIPLGNVAPRSEVRRAQLELEKAELTLKSVESRIMLEVEKAARQIRTAIKAIEGSQTLREQAERRLEMAKEQFELALVPMTAVMEAERDLASAESGALKAVFDYNKVLAFFEKATGATLEKFNVEF